MDGAENSSSPPHTASDLGCGCGTFSSSGEVGGVVLVESLGSAEKIILRWDSTVSEEARDKMIFSGDRLEVDRYLQAVDHIQNSLRSVSLSSPTPNPDTTTTTTIQIAMARLEDEFRTILLSSSTPVDAESLLVDTPRSNSNSRSSDHFSAAVAAAAEADGSSRGGGSGSGGGGGSFMRSMRLSTSIREIDLIGEDAVADLRSIAERMIAAGYLRECVQVYGSVRKSSVDASFRNLGIEKLSIGDIQRLEWDALENKIRHWIKAAKVCIRTLFASEKRLSELIFEGLSSSSAITPPLQPLFSLSSPSRSYSFSSSYSDACFLETVKGPAIQLFNFAEAISISRRSPEKLFKILDLHDALADLLPDIDVVFESKAAESIRVQAAEILSRLAEAARGILSEFENAVLREPSKVPVPGGTIHPLTRGVGIGSSTHRLNRNNVKRHLIVIVVLILMWGGLWTTFGILEKKDFKKGGSRAQLWLACFFAPFGVWVRWWLASLNGRGLGESGSLRWIPFGTLTANISVVCMMAALAILKKAVDTRKCEVVASAVQFGFIGCLSTVPAFIAEFNSMRQSSKPWRAYAYTGVCDELYWSTSMR